MLQSYTDRRRGTIRMKDLIENQFSPLCETRPFSTSCCLSALYVAYAFLRPYLGVIIFSIVITLVFRPVYRRYLVWFPQTAGSRDRHDDRDNVRRDPHPADADRANHHYAAMPSRVTSPP